MNSYTGRSALLNRQRDRFETLIGRSDYVTAYHPKHVGRLFTQLGTGVINWLTVGSMPRISKQAQGEAEVWKAYDPVTNRTAYFDSENDLRIWIEERYYQ